MKVCAILDRYILGELISPFLFGIAAFSGIFIAADLVYLARVAVSVGAPFLIAVELALMKFPQILVYALPMSTLMGVLLALGKLSQNSELIAMFACGRGFWRTVRPVLFFGLCVTILGLFVNDVLAPKAVVHYEVLYSRMVSQKPLPVIKRNVLLEEYQGGRLKSLIYASMFDPSTSTFTDVTYFTFFDGKPETTTQAQTMIWEEDAWYLLDGSTIFHNSSSTTEMRFQKSIHPVTIKYQPKDVALIEKNPSQMGIRELKRKIDLLDRQSNKLKKLLIEYHQKISVPFASLIFAVLGAALAVGSPRSGSARGFGLSIAIVFLYYVLLTLSSVLGEGGQFSPAFSAWAQNIVIGSWSLWLAIKRGR